ncbi:hypothetical protein C0Q70_05835 [Pomacea canaliculata]|uniref:Bromodomain associated domain-containing protein n=2 Tax=Pomacea canaliculata TaxID=400727 RepID=A0A2T7PMB2_POMCA|nr:hypothetical protein C0Q70_05835 [Pomacea canaliculata]
MSGLWGEIPTVPETDSGIAAIEREQITKPRPMEVEGPPLHQPSSRHHPPTNEPLPARWFQIDPVTLHTIRLIQHTRKTRQAIQYILHQQSTQTENKGDGESSFPIVPPIPEYTRPPLQHEEHSAVPYIPANFDSDFVKGIGETPPAIDEIANRKLLRRSVAAILAHMSFECAPESVLETLTDVTHEYYLQFMKHLRAAADAAGMNGLSGFPDIIEKVFHEMGIGSVTTLHEFYQTRILAYHKHMIETCKHLVTEYEKLKQPTSLKSPSNGQQKDTLHIIRIKEEPSAEIQFPVLDENDEVIEAERFLQLEGLGSFEITVEHETASGLTTEVESKWTQPLKSEHPETRGKHSDGDEGVAPSDVATSCLGGGGSQDIPSVPRSVRGAGMDGDGSQGPVSAPTQDLGSPNSPSLSAPSKVKRK